MSGPEVDATAVMRSWYEDAIHQPYSLMQGEDARTGALLVHGFTGSPADMRAVADVVHGVGIDTHAMLLPGMARDIDHLNDMTAIIWRDAVRQRWREHYARYEKRVLIGYSMGGTLALLASVDQPPDILILIAPLMRLADRRAIFLPLARYIRSGVHPYADLDWDNPHVHDWFDRTRSSMGTRNPVNQAVLTRDAIYSFRMLDEMRRLLARARRIAPKITAPAVIVQGINDRVVLPQETRRLVTRMGGAVTYREIPGDHYLPLPAFDGWPRLRRILDEELHVWIGNVEP